MNNFFRKIGLAITFSPTGKVLLHEALRLKNLFDAELVLFHVGEKSRETENQMEEIFTAAGINYSSAKVIWDRGDPADVIIKNAKQENLSLLIAGALETEKFLKYYIGSVARKIMRKSPVPVLILTGPMESTSKFNSIYISTDFSEESERVVRMAHELALKEKAEEFILVREINIPALASAVQESGSLEGIEKVREKLKKEEEAKMLLFVNELNLKGVDIKVKCLYGKEGWEAGNFAKENNADLFVVKASKRKFGFVDRIFPHELEYSFEHLPTNLLIVR